MCIYGILEYIYLNKMKKKLNFYAFVILLRYSAKNPKNCVHVVLKRKEMILIISLVSLFLLENHGMHKKRKKRRKGDI